MFSKVRNINPDSHPIADINITPFVDVLLFLLIIFMIFSSIQMYGIEIELPKNQEVIENNKNPLVVTLNKNGEIYLQQNRVTKEELVEKIKSIKDLNNDVKIFLQGDVLTNYGNVMDIFSLLKRSFYEQVVLVTE